LEGTHVEGFFLFIFGDCLGGCTCGNFYFLFWGWTTSFLVEHSNYLAPYTFMELDTLGFTHLDWLLDLSLFLEVVVEHSPRRIIILFIILSILEGTLGGFS
jgi:hypothetical protein